MILNTETFDQRHLTLNYNHMLNMMIIFTCSQLTYYAFYFYSFIKFVISFVVFNHNIQSII